MVVPPKMPLPPWMLLPPVALLILALWEMKSLPLL